MARRDDKKYENFRPVKLEGVDLSSGRRRRRRPDTTSLRDECIETIMKDVIKDDIPEILHERIIKALHYLIRWNSQQRGQPNMEADKFVEVFHHIWKSIDYPKGKRAGYNQDEHLSTYLYQYIPNFPEMFVGLMSMSAVYDRERIGVRDKIDDLMKNKDIAADELLPLLYHKPLRNLFLTPMPMIPIPLEKRFEHTHVLAKTGHGKTQFLLQLIYNDVKRAQKGKGGFCIIDSQTDLINTVAHLKEFEPDARDSLADKLIIVDPSDTKFPVSLNLFDINPGRIENMDAEIKEQAYNFATALYGYIFSGLIKGDLTMYQENIFQFCANVLLNIPKATVHTFIDFLKAPNKYDSYIEKLDETTKGFFADEFNSNVYKQTKTQLSARLWALLRSTVFKNMITADYNKIDMFEAMNEGKIVLINTSKMTLQSERAGLLGKFFIALILQSAFLRAGIPERERKPFFVYIDEAQDYMTDKMTELLAQVRKYKIGAIMAHQFMKQLDDVSNSLKDGMLTNTTIKFVGKVLAADRRIMSDAIGVDKESFAKLKKVDHSHTEYFAFVDNVTPVGIKVRVPFGVINKKDKMSDESYNSLIENNRRKYCYALPDEKSRKENSAKKDEKQFKVGKKPKLL